MHLIIGLGNPGPQYAQNRHNAGFMALTQLAEKLSQASAGRFKSSLALKTSLGGCPVVLAWPQTYMNLSGEAVLELASFYKISKENILVLHDEMDLPPGRIKLVTGGGTAGHNGLNSIVTHLGQNFTRIKIGIGRPPKEIFTQPQGHADYVLNDFLELERPLLEESFKMAVEASETWVTGGLTKAQNKINRRRPKALVSVESEGVESEGEK